MPVTRKIRHKDETGTITEADIGALAENVVEDAQHRFVTDIEKAEWKATTEEILEKIYSEGQTREYVDNELREKIDAEAAAREAKDEELIKRLDNYRTVALEAALWEGAEAPYAQTISVEGVTSASELTLVYALADGADAATQKAYSKAFGIVATGTATVGNGSVTFKVYKRPTTDIEVGLRGN